MPKPEMTGRTANPGPSVPSACCRSKGNKLLALAAASEAATGVVLLVYPPIVGRLLFGAEIAGAGVVMSRIGGMSLIALGLACWPGCEAGSGATNALRAMLSYSLLVTLYLGYLGAVREWVGILLWPTVGFHALVTILLARAWLEDRQAR